MIWYVATLIASVISTRGLAAQALSPCMEVGAQPGGCQDSELTVLSAQTRHSGGQVHKTWRRWLPERTGLWMEVSRENPARKEPTLSGARAEEGVGRRHLLQRPLLTLSGAVEGEGERI
ncbi:immunoglobulin superfamily member 9B [Phyllostomus discolor]|nr:immunoglobulin superfamily member 9B [Phyllostomus discolor]